MALFAILFAYLQLLSYRGLPPSLILEMWDVLLALPHRDLVQSNLFAAAASGGPGAVINGTCTTWKSTESVMKNDENLGP